MKRITKQRLKEVWDNSWFVRLFKWLFRKQKEVIE